MEKSALLGAGLTLSPLMVRMAAKPVGANDKIHLGLIGCRGQGFTNLQAFLRNPEVDCIALCDIDSGVLEQRAADTEKIQGKKVKHLYKDWRKLIDNTLSIGIVSSWLPPARPGRMSTARNRLEIALRNVI